MTASISVLGAGSWGTALAIHAARNGCDTLLWGHNPQHVAALTVDRENRRYLPGCQFPDRLQTCHELQLAAAFSDLLLISVPSHAFKDTLQQIKPYLRDGSQIAWATKGFNPEDSSLLSSVVDQVLGASTECAVLSGPTFAKEVAVGLPTAITAASISSDLAARLSQTLHNQLFRVYTSTDIIGVQVGGACKNVLAIAAGIADGLGFGANTRAALITRGLNEIMRLGLKLGGQPETLMGLAGLGDLLLTCTDNQSRNRRFGLALGQGKGREHAIAEIAQEIEGIFAARETFLLSQKHGIDMPIIEQTYRVLFEGLAPKQAVQNLLTRDPKAEVC